MRTLNQLRRSKMGCSTFKALYEQECNLCPITARLFETLDGRDLSLKSLADVFEVKLESLRLMRDADLCDPNLVIRLYDHLGLSKPVACPKMPGNMQT